MFVLSKNPLKNGIHTTLHGHSDRINCVKFIKKDHDQTTYTLVSISADKTARVWNGNLKTNAWVCNSVLNGHSQAIVALAVKEGNDSDLIATSASDGDVRIWEIKSMADGVQGMAESTRNKFKDLRIVR
jgi:WD40 repeat protein